MQVTTIGIDLVQHVFQVYGITAGGTVIFNRAIRRSQLVALFDEDGRMRVQSSLRTGTLKARP